MAGQERFDEQIGQAVIALLLRSAAASTAAIAAGE